MKHIAKGPEPSSLTQHRLQAYADFDNYAEKDDLRAALLTEQGKICCYCMQRIAETESKIEHWSSQTGHPARQLEYSNLLLACLGGEGSPRHLQHCDTHKRHDDITVNPADSGRNCEHLIRYAPDGHIYSDYADIDRDINVVLNLNLQSLKNNRAAVLDGAIESLRRSRPDGQWTLTFLDRAKRTWQDRGRDGAYNEYCRIVIAYLDKKSDRL